MSSADVVNVAVPPLTVTIARGKFPSRNVTVPVGVPEAVTVAVNVTGCPASGAGLDDVSVTDECCRPLILVRTMSFPSPPAYVMVKT
jgi:hypothetical protein